MRARTLSLAYASRLHDFVPTCITSPSPNASSPVPRFLPKRRSLLAQIAEIKKVQVANGTWNRPGHDPVAHPTWIKQPGDWATLGFGGLLVGYGLITCVIGHYRLATGKGKIDA